MDQSALIGLFTIESQRVLGKYVSESEFLSKDLYDNKCCFNDFSLRSSRDYYFSLTLPSMRKYLIFPTFQWVEINKGPNRFEGVKRWMG